MPSVSRRTRYTNFIPNITSQYIYTYISLTFLSFLPPSLSFTFTFSLILSALGLLVGSLNHSCDPNVFVAFPEGNCTAHIVTLREVSEGEEVCVAYIDVDEPVDVRRRALLEHGFVCQCAKCVEESVDE